MRDGPIYIYIYIYIYPLAIGTFLLLFLPIRRNSHKGTESGFISQGCWWQLIRTYSRVDELLCISHSVTTVTHSDLSLPRTGDSR